VRANNLYRQHEHALAFSQGRSVIKGTYDHTTGKFTEERFVDPGEVMIFQGLHSLSNQALREMYDLKIFLNPEEDLRCLWKVQRDQRERGYRPQDVLRSLDARRQDREAYVLPQMQHADLIVRWSPTRPVDPSAADVTPELRLSVVAVNSFDLSELVEDFRNFETLTVKHTPCVESKWQSLELEGTAAESALRNAARRLERQLKALRPALAFRSGLAGCLQLILLTALVQGSLWRNRPPDL
jgi:Phosphoribulokinase / Uridine kinase family